MNALGAALVVLAILVGRSPTVTARARLPAKSRTRVPARRSAGWLAPVATCVAVLTALVVDPWLLVPMAGVPAVLVMRRLRAAPPDSGELALALDLLGACLDAGATLPAALEAAATVAGQRIGPVLRSAASALAHGGEAEAWAPCLAHQELAPAVRICRRAGTTGAAAAADLRRLAMDVRRRQQALRRARAQRAAVWVVLPLGLCFLPSFLLLTVVPVVATLLPRMR